MCKRAVLRSSSASCLLLTLFPAPPCLSPRAAKREVPGGVPAARGGAAPVPGSRAGAPKPAGQGPVRHTTQAGVRALNSSGCTCVLLPLPLHFSSGLYLYSRLVFLHQAAALCPTCVQQVPDVLVRCILLYPLQRPQSAVARTMEVLGPEAMLQLRTSTTAAPTAGTHTAYTQAGAHGQSSYLSHLGGASSASLAASAAGGGRPQSAPVKRPASAAPSAYQGSAVDVAAGGTVRYKQPEAQVGATPRRPHSAVQRTGQRDRAVHITQRPTGDHWSLYSTAPQAQVQSVQGAPTLGGALVAAVGSGTGTGTASAGGAAAGSGAWTPPKKSAIEASFLSRLQRSASCRG